MIIRKRKVDLDSVYKILCDWCGENFLIYEKGSDTYYPCGGTVEVNFGYGSKFDNCEIETFEGDICDKCFEKHMLNKVRKRMI
jgi:hypothetical protein